MHRFIHRLGALLFLPLFAFGQIGFQATPNPHPVFFGLNGLALVGGQVCTYASGTTTPLATYKDNLGTANSTCITLDAGGSAFIYLGQSAYKFITFNSLGVQQYVYDPVSNFTQFLLSTQNAWTQPQQLVGGTSDPTGSAGLFWYRSDASRFEWFDSAWHRFVGEDTSQTLTNKTLTSPTLNGPVINEGSPTPTALISPTAPTIAAAGCGGSAASISSNSGTASFRINVGTAPTSSGCTVTLPAATTGWNCSVTDVTTNSTSVFLQKQTGGSVTTAILQNFSDVAVATAPTASDIWQVACFAN